MGKLKEEKEKQAAMEERQRAALGKQKLKSRRPAASDSGGESTRGPTPVEAGGTNPQPTRRTAATGGPGCSEGPLLGAPGPERRDLGAEPRWGEERWRRERGMEHCDRWEAGAELGRPRVGRGPSVTRGEMRGQERFLPRPQGEEAVVGEGRG